MSLFNSDATVAKVVQYFNDNPSIAANSRAYWTGIDMGVHSNQPFFRTWVTFCAISKMINDYYYYSADNPSYPKRTPVNFKFVSTEKVEMTVSFIVEQDNINEVSGSNVNGYLMSNMGSSYASSSFDNYYKTETPYFDTTSPRANQPLQLIWDSARVLNALARGGAENRDLPNHGGLAIRIGEGSERFRVSIKSDVPIVSPLIPAFSETKDTPY